MATLSIQIPGGDNIDFPISSKSTMIGRDPSCDLVINNSYISAKHAIVHQSEEGSFLIEDQDSTHGVLVNGQRVAAEKLTDGDTITLGQLDLILHVTDVPKQKPTKVRPVAKIAKIAKAPVQATPQHVPTANPAQASPLRPPQAATPKANPLQPPANTPTAKPQLAAPPLIRRGNSAAQTPSASPIQQPGPATTQPLPDSNVTKPVPMRPGPPKKKESNDDISWPKSSTAKKAGSPAPNGLPTQKNESGPRTSQDSPSREQIEAKKNTEAEINELQDKLAKLKKEENEKRNLYQDSLEDMRNHIAELGQEKRKLREKVEGLRDRCNAVQSRVDDEDDAFLPVMFEVVKRVDLLEGMIHSLESDDNPTSEALTQLKTLRASFEELYKRHNIRTETIDPGAQLNLGLRRRVRIVDDSGNALEQTPATETTKSQGPIQSKVKATVRPGIVYAPEDGDEVLLRKVEVTVEEI
ncbi:FHA domain-containing protein [Sulfuriroseicoccus oceanibius]|uniref:FHA domain-containing protein n=1 Tax=Sulfuriroseicoccus oceanibius TaxID=2707525 RepID=A0A6B3L6G3_9BACT|nr:FHA domain-containing protein [Sulfuriroseicoccus oceanibius]QQL46186.1 FHA domain-containing protein [Sulfuriroseicoccus oceanibius]